MSAHEQESRWQRFYRVVREIPKGFVATYGQVAALAGFPRHARQVGYALFALREAAQDDPVPWHRVVNARGEISQRSDPGPEPLQRVMLEAEGVAFDTFGRIAMKRYQWQP